jgi:hypothetical protein
MAQTTTEIACSASPLILPLAPMETDTDAKAKDMATVKTVESNFRAAFETMRKAYLQRLGDFLDIKILARPSYESGWAPFPEIGWETSCKGAVRRYSALSPRYSNQLS